MKNNNRTAFVTGCFKRTAMEEAFLFIVKKKMKEEGKDFNQLLQQKKEDREEVHHGSLRI